MLEKIKTIPITNLIIVGLLCYIIFSNMFSPKTVVKTDTTVYEKQIEQFNAKVQSLLDANKNSDKKIDSLKLLLEKTTTNINYIQKQLQDEKIKLNSMSDDDNIRYFHDYVRAYEASKSNGN